MPLTLSQLERHLLRTRHVTEADPGASEICIPIWLLSAMSLRWGILDPVPVVSRNVEWWRKMLH